MNETGSMLRISTVESNGGGMKTLAPRTPTRLAVKNQGGGTFNTNNVTRKPSSSIAAVSIQHILSPQMNNRENDVNVLINGSNDTAYKPLM